ncbi:MAG: hypothetical protein MRQ13_01880 [Candidatus Midichloria sp.]|nr:hypothetical protein [Candidatus Midichloria sp.]
MVPLKPTAFYTIGSRAYAVAVIDFNMYAKPSIVTVNVGAGTVSVLLEAVMELFNL